MNHQSIVESIKQYSWMDFGSLLGLLRDQDPYLGGDLDMGIWMEDYEVVLEILKSLDEPLLVRKVKGHPMSIKVEIDPPVDIHLWRKNGHLAYSCSGYMPERVNNLLRGAITRLLRSNGSIDQGIWPYRPVTWSLPSSLLGRGPEYQGWPLPNRPIRVIQSHYGESWMIPYRGPWVWYRGHHSIRKGVPF